MPIILPRTLKRLSRDEFRELDYAVMAQAFACHNELGRLCDERAYQVDLAERLRASGFDPVTVNSRIDVEHGSFRKTYRIDLIVADAAIYELKATAELAREHEGQLLNYLLLSDQVRNELPVATSIPQSMQRSVTI